MNRRRLLRAIPAAVLGVAALVALVARAAPDAGAPAPAGDPAAEAARRNDPNVRIVFTVVPSAKKATVFWGKKRLGVIEKQRPLVVSRPRDSGPLDVMVRAEGCVPVQTRAYTFNDNKVAVKVTPVDQKNTILGYREELPPEDGGVPSPNPDAGVR